MDVERLGLLKARIHAWVAAQPDICAVVLVGSWARGQARPDSDVDLVVLVDEPDVRLKDTAWLAQIGAVEHVRVESYGAVTSLRVDFAEANLPQVEFGIAPERWARMSRTDPGTISVVRDGFSIWWDPEDRFHQRK